MFHLYSQMYTLANCSGLREKRKSFLKSGNQNTKELTMFQTESQNYDHPQYFTQSHEIYGERPTLKRPTKQTTTTKKLPFLTDEGKLSFSFT